MKLVLLDDYNNQVVYGTINMIQLLYFFFKLRFGTQNLDLKRQCVPITRTMIGKVSTFFFTSRSYYVVYLVLRYSPFLRVFLSL